MVSSIDAAAAVIGAIRNLRMFCQYCYVSDVCVPLGTAALMTGISAADGHTDPAVKRKSALEQSDSDLLSEESEDVSEDETELDLIGEDSESGDSEHTIDPSESADDLASEAVSDPDGDPDTKTEEADATSDEDSLSEHALKERRSTPDAETSPKGLAPGECHWHVAVPHAAW